MVIWTRLCAGEPGALDAMKEVLQNWDTFLTKVEEALDVNSLSGSDP